MSGISDIAMRSIARRCGSDITFSEFISSDALHFKPENDKSFMLAKFINEERPFIIQLFGREPERFASAIKILNKKFKPDGYDVNFGCPARSVVGNGAGSCLFLEPNRAKQIIKTVKEASGGLATSIKLRASYKHVGVIEFLNAIEGAPFENVTLHMRSYEQVHHGPANWDSGKTMTEYLHARGITSIVNGGISTGTQAKDCLDYTGADGIMVAQATLGNPFLFQEIKAALNGESIPKVPLSLRITTALDHAALMLEHKGAHGIIEMRKHLLWYFKGFPNAADLRKQLVTVETLPEIEKILHSYSTTSPQDIP